MIDKTSKIAILGTGLMGAPMAETLLKSGYRLIAYNRTSARAEPLVGAGAEVVSTAKLAVDRAECVILMVADATAIRDVLFPQGEPPVLKGRIVIQMGTIAPAESRSLGDEELMVWVLAINRRPCRTVKRFLSNFITNFPNEKSFSGHLHDCHVCSIPG